jgi:hypothetical protein
MDKFDVARMLINATSSIWSTRLVDDLTWEVCYALAELGFVKDMVGRQAEHVYSEDTASVYTEFHLTEPVNSRRLLVRTILTVNGQDGQIGAAWLDVEVRGEDPKGNAPVHERPLLAHARVLQAEPCPFPLDQPVTSPLLVTHVRRGMTKLSDADMERIGQAIAQQLHKVLQQ